METDWKNATELDASIHATETEIKNHQKELDKLVNHLNWLLSEKDRLCNHETLEKEGNKYYNIDGFHTKRHLPSVPTRQFSEGGSSSNSLHRSSTTSFKKLNISSRLNKNRAVSCSLENLTSHESSKNKLFKSESNSDKRFSTIDLSFLKKLTSYSKSPKRIKESSLVTSPSISSVEDHLSESVNSLNASGEDLDNTSLKSDEGGKSSSCSKSPADDGVYKTNLHRSKAIYTKKKRITQKKECGMLGDDVSVISEDQSFLSDDLSLDDLSENVSLYDDDEAVSQPPETSLGTTSSSSLSVKSEKPNRKTKFNTALVSRSKSSVFNREEDDFSQCSVYSMDCGEKLVVIENFLALEKSYVEKLQILVENYEQKLRDHSKNSLTLRHNINTVFHHPCHFLMIHKSFLIAAQHRLKKQALVPILFGDLFLEMVNQFKVYIEYAKDFQNLMETLSAVQTQCLATKDLMDTIEKQVHISLPDLFHVPLRQVESYQHTIRDVREHMSPHNNESIILEEAEYKLEEITNNIDTIMADMRKRAKSYRKRELIYKGMMAGQTEKGVLKMRYMFLYNDVMVCARMPKGPDHASFYLPKWYLPLSDILLPLTHESGRPIDTIQLKQMKVRIKETQRQLKEEDQYNPLDKGAVSKRMRGFKKQRIRALKDALKDKIEEYQIMHMVFPFKIISKRGKTYTMHMQSEKERSEWMNQIQSQLNKVPACTTNISLTLVEVEHMLKRYTKLRKNSVLNKLDIDNDDELLYDGVLLVQVICGTDLGEIGTKPDVYCTLEADCNGVMCKKTKTKVIKGTTNPIWDETLCIQAAACQFFRIHAFNKKQFQRPTEIGVKLLTLAENKLEDNKPHALVVNLQPKGQIKLTIQLLSQEMARARKESQHQTFGVPLDELALIEGQKIPPIIHSCFREIECRGIYEEGIYRVPGVNGEIRRLKSAYDESTTNGEVLANEADINVVAGVVKQFFRELPSPLFPEELYSDFVSLLDTPDEGAKDQMMDVFSEIPEPNISVIVRLIQHIQYIAGYKSQNRMDVNNLALVFGPNVVKPPITQNGGDLNSLSCQSENMLQQINVLKFFCEKPLQQIKELHGDEESLRPSSAPAILSPTSERNVPAIVRHISVSRASSDVITEEDYNFGLHSPVIEGTDDLFRDVSAITDNIQTDVNTDSITDLSYDGIFDNITRGMGGTPEDDIYSDIFDTLCSRSSNNGHNPSVGISSNHFNTDVQYPANNNYNNNSADQTDRPAQSNCNNTLVNSESVTDDFRDLSVVVSKHVDSSL